MASLLPVHTDAVIVDRFYSLPSLVRGWLLGRPRFEPVSVHRIEALAREWRAEAARYGLDSYMRGWLTARAVAFEAAVKMLGTPGGNSGEFWGT